jgi:hypothetical protein
MAEDEAMSTIPTIEMIHLQDGEILIGFYDDSSKGNENNIVVTSLGLYVNNPDEPDFIDYRTIEQVEIPKNGEKSKLDYFVVRLNDGQTKNIPVTGGHDRLRDVFEFIRFVDRVIDDVKRDNSPHAG